MQPQTLETWADSAVLASEVQIFLMGTESDVWLLGHKVISAPLAVTNEKSRV